MKASQIIALSTSVFFAGLSAHGYTTAWGNALPHIQAGAHNQSPTAESHKKYPSRKEAIEQLMKFEGNASKAMYKPIVCTVQEHDEQWQYKHTLLNTDFQNVMYAGSKYIITVEGGQNGTDWIVINTFHIWDSKTLKHIKALACIAPRDTKYIAVDEANDRFAVSLAESHGACVDFAYDIKTDDLEYTVYWSEDEEEMEKDHSFKKKAFKSFNQASYDYEGANNHAAENYLTLKGLKDYFDTEKTDIINRLDFDTLQLKPRKKGSAPARHNISIEDIDNAPAGMKMEDSGSIGNNDCGFRVLYPARFQYFSDIQNENNRESLGVKLYDIKNQRLLPISPSYFIKTHCSILPKSGESDCGKLFYSFTHVYGFHGWIYSWSAPQLFNEASQQWEIITFNGNQPENASLKCPVAYDVKANVPDGLGAHLSVWNRFPDDEEHTYWIAAADGFCGLFLMNETTKTGKLIQSWRGAWSVAEENYPVPVWLAERQWLCIPVEKHGWEVYELNDFRQPAQKKFDIYVGGRESWAIMLPNGHYAGSPGCESLFTRYTNGEEANMQALALWRNRPAEVLEVLGGNEDDIEALKATTKRWLAKKGFNMDAMPPEPEHAEFAKVEVGEQELMHKTNTVTFPVQITAGAKKAMTALQVRVNGAEIRQAWSDTLLVTPGSTETVHVSIPLESGQNMIELAPIDSTGIEGVATTFRMVKTTPAPSKLYVVTLGVSDYDQDELDLQFAAKDAKDLRRAFARYGSGEVKTLTLTDKEVNDKSVLKKVQDFLSSTKAEDRVVLYLAGHGMLNDALEYHYAPAGFDPQKISETGISMDALVACLQTASARERLLILDTCHSGTLGEEGEDKLASSGIQLPHGVRAIQNRGMKLKKATGALTSSKQRKRYIEDMFSMGNQYRGVNIIAGAAGAEYALESGEWNNGVFTASLIQLLKDCTLTDLNSDGYMSVQELAAALQTKVHQLTGGAQKPNLVASASPYTALSSSICSYVINEDWDAICHRILGISDKRELTLVLDSFLVMDRAGSTFATADEIEQKIKELENKRHSYSEEEKEYLRAVANVIFKHRGRESYSVSTPYKVWACAVKAGLKPRALLQYQDLCEYDHRTALKQLAEGKKATSSANSGELAKLQTLIGYLRAANYTDRTYQLYQRRLLAVLPIIANGGYVNTNIDTVLKNSNGTTALHNACGLGYYALVEWLLRNGANVHARATNGATPIQCVSNDPHGQISALLRKYGAPATVTATRTNSGELEKLQTLIGYLRAANYTDRTHQLYQRRLLAVLPIIANGGYVNTNIDTVLKNSNGTTALHNACGLGYYALVEWLLRNGANVHARATNGATPEQCVGDDNDPLGQIRALIQRYK